MGTRGVAHWLVSGTACVVALAAGCDSVFGLHRSDGTIDGPASDGPGGDDAGGLVDAAPLPVCTSPNQQLTLPVLADTYLDAAGPHGAEPALRLSHDHTLLIAFETGTLTFSNVELTLTHPVFSRACGTNGACGQCPNDVSGMLHLHWVRSDWSELTADRAFRDLGAPWAQAGATGGTDRSGVIGGSASMVAGQLHVGAQFQANDRQAGWPQDVLGVELVPDTDTSALSGMFASKDARGDCGGVVPGPTLVVTCQP